jgi:nicotinamidase-related amidase
MLHTEYNTFGIFPSRNIVLVVFVRVAFRECFPEVSLRNKMFSAFAGVGGMTDLETVTQIHDSMKPQPDEPFVTKRRVSAFAGSDLEVILRSRQAEVLTVDAWIDTLE